MKVKFIQFPEHDIIPKGIIGESTLYELLSPFDPKNEFSKFWLQCHKCGLTANLGSHDSIEIDNGNVTISPSIQCPKCPAHYWIKNGEVT